jgi:hypothetical protein
MKAKAALSLLLLGVLTAALLLPHGTAAAKGRKPLTVGKDAKGDWGENAGAPELAPLGAALGQDLVGAAIGMGKKKTINFIIKGPRCPRSEARPRPPDTRTTSTGGFDVFKIMAKEHRH